jgi:hypothetical protein
MPLPRTISTPESQSTATVGVQSAAVHSKVEVQTLPSQRETEPARTQEIAEENKIVESNQDKAKSISVSADVPEKENIDSPMTGVADPGLPSDQEKSLAADEEKEPLASDKPPVTAGSNVPTPVEVDGEKGQSKQVELPQRDLKDEPITPGGPASGTRAALQSPIITSKPLNPPTSVKRVSRRSSAARKLSGDSGDGYSENSKGNMAASLDGEIRENEREGSRDEDGDVNISPITRRERNEMMRDGFQDREPGRTPPRRNANGRFTRKKTLG